MLVKGIAPAADHRLDAVFRIAWAFALEKMEIGHPVEFAALREPPALQIETDAVLTGIGRDTGAALADTAGQNRQQGKGPALEIAVVPLVVAGPVDDMQRRVAGGIDGHPLDLHRIETGDRRHLVEVIVDKQSSAGR